jgi:hypothetical protein
MIMKLGDNDLGPHFPVFGRAFEYLRTEDQGPSFRRVRITLAGFLEGDYSEEVMALYQILKDRVGINDTTFTYIDTSVTASGVTIYDALPVWIGSYNEPIDGEFGKNASGDYSIELYHFEEQDDNLGITVKYGSYTFDCPPSWSRRIRPNRDTPRGPLRGSTASITLSGFLVAETHPELRTKMNALEAAFKVDNTLHYGNFSQACRVVDCSIPRHIPVNFCFFDIELSYDLDQIVTLRRRATISRIHDHPVITEEPFCSRRLVELMNRSGQTISYQLYIEVSPPVSTPPTGLALARQLLAVEAANWIEPGGIEMPGGTEEWDEDRISVALNVTKFYRTAVIGNLPGTG